MTHHRFVSIFRTLVSIAAFLGMSALGIAASSSHGPSATADPSPGNRIKVTFINPGISNPNDPTGGFWTSVTEFMKPAAAQLNIDLEVLYAERDHLRMQQLAREVADRPVRPDYLLVVNEKQAADEMIKTADRVGLKVFLMQNNFLGQQAKEMGRPRQRYPHWIGSQVPDHQAGGYQIAKQIIERGLHASAPGSAHLQLFAIMGDASTEASVQRVQGLKRAVAEYPNVEVVQTVRGNWRRDIAYEQTKIALTRYPGIRVIWAANDPMALGALQAAIEAKRRPGEDIFIGGLNWDAPALEKVKEGSLVTSVGGHFMGGAWALVLLYDYHHGRDFAEESTEFISPMFGALNRGNIDRFLEKFSDRNWSKIDFTRFSKVRNPDLKQYDFSPWRVVDP